MSWEVIFYLVAHVSQCKLRLSTMGYNVYVSIRFYHAYYHDFTYITVNLSKKKYGLIPLLKAKHSRFYYTTSVSDIANRRCYR